MRKNIRIMMVGVSLVLAACGFQPLYAPFNDTGEVIPQLANIHVANIDDRLGQQMRGELQKRLNPVGQPSAAAYILTVKLSESKQDLGIERDTSVTFSRLTVRASYVLNEAATGEELFRSVATSVNSFNVVQSPYANQSAEDNARRRAIADMAEDIRLRLSVYFQQRDQRPARTHNLLF